MSLQIAEAEDFADCALIRRRVFIEEQGIPEAEEWDDRDAVAIQLLARQGARPVGTARLLTDGDTGWIGRVAVLAEARGSGVGAALIRAGADRLQQIPRIARLCLGAQVHAQGFYEKLGFRVSGPEYLDGGIPHCEMTRDLRPALSRDDANPAA